MTGPRVLLVPHFRRMDEIFDASTLDRLRGFAEVVWGRDGAMPVDALMAELPTVEAVVFGTWQYGAAAIRSATERLEVVIEVAGGHNHPDLDYDWLQERGIPIGSCAPAFGPAVAEMGLALTLAAARLVVDSDRGFRAGQERYLHDGNAGAVSLYGKRVGLVGCGGLSRALQPLLAPFGVPLVGYDPWLDDRVLAERGIERAETLEEIFGSCEVIYVLAVPTADNEQMITRALLERLRPDDVLVLLSRAHLVDFEALTDLLLAGRFRAGIDVFPAEPLPADHRIRRADHSVLTAHLAGAMPEALHAIGRMVVDDLDAVFSGRSPSRMQYLEPATRSRLIGS